MVVKRPDPAAILARVETDEPLDGDLNESEFTDAMLDRYPHRNPKRLERAWADSETVSEAAQQLEVSPDTVSRWLEVFGLRERWETTGARWVRHNVAPEDLGLDSVEPEGSA